MTSTSRLLPTPGSPRSQTKHALVGALADRLGEAWLPRPSASRRRASRLAHRRRRARFWAGRTAPQASDSTGCGSGAFPRPRRACNPAPSLHCGPALTHLVAAPPAHRPDPAPCRSLDGVRGLLAPLLPPHPVCGLQPSQSREPEGRSTTVAPHFASPPNSPSPAGRPLGVLPHSLLQEHLWVSGPPRAHEGLHERPPSLGFSPPRKLLGTAAKWCRTFNANRQHPRPAHSRRVLPATEMDTPSH